MIRSLLSYAFCIFLQCLIQIHCSLQKKNPLISWDFGRDPGQLQQSRVLSYLPCSAMFFVFKLTIQLIPFIIHELDLANSVLSRHGDYIISLYQTAMKGNFSTLGHFFPSCRYVCSFIWSFFAFTVNQKLSRGTSWILSYWIRLIKFPGTILLFMSIRICSLFIKTVLFKLHKGSSTKTFQIFKTKVSEGQVPWSLSFALTHSLYTITIPPHYKILCRVLRHTALGSKQSSVLFDYINFFIQKVFGEAYVLHH